MLCLRSRRAKVSVRQGRLNIFFFLLFVFFNCGLTFNFSAGRRFGWPDARRGARSQGEAVPGLGDDPLGRRRRCAFVSGPLWAWVFGFLILLFLLLARARQTLVFSLSFRHD